MALQINNQLEDYFEGTFIPNAAALRSKHLFLIGMAYLMRAEKTLMGTVVLAK